MSDLIDDVFRSVRQEYPNYPMTTSVVKATVLATLRAIKPTSPRDSYDSYVAIWVQNLIEVLGPAEPS